MKNKISLQELKVKSFITDGEDFDKRTIKGGSSWIFCRDEPLDQDPCDPDEHNSFCTDCGCGEG